MCTSFLAFKSNKFCVTGRSLDYDHPDKYIFKQYPVGHSFKSVLNNGVSWKSTHGIFTIDSVVQDVDYPIPFEGMNSAGISISGNLANASYPENNPGPTISTDDMVNWVLSQAGTIEEAQELLCTVNIDSKWQYHYIVFDKTGNSLVVEYENKSAVAHQNKTKVLTNNPNLNYHLENQNNFANLRNWFPGAILPDSGDQFHGQGMFGMPGDWMSTSRFTRATIMLNYSVNNDFIQNNADAIFVARKILDSVSLIKGIDLGSKPDGKPIYTQIQIVKDLLNSVVYTCIYDDANWEKHVIEWG